MVAYIGDQISTYFHLFRIVYKNIIDKGGRVVTNGCWFISGRNELWLDTKKSLLYCEVSNFSKSMLKSPKI